MIDRISVLFIVCMLSWSNTIKSEPNRYTEYLINEPVSLLDYGLDLLANDLQSLVDEQEFGLKLQVHAKYEWNSNSIVIVIMINDQKGTILEAKDRSKQIVKIIRKHFMINPETGSPYSDEFGSYIDLHFRHKSDIYLAEPDGLGQEIDNIVEILIETVLVKELGIIRAKAKLLGSDISFVER